MHVSGGSRGGAVDAQVLERVRKQRERVVVMGRHTCQVITCRIGEAEARVARVAAAGGVSRICGRWEP